MQIREKELDSEIPSVFINRIHKKSQIQFTTIEMMLLNERIKESLNEIYMISDNLLLPLFEQSRMYSTVLYRLNDALALLDYIVSLTSYSMATNTIRPKFGDTMAVRNGRHPLKEADSQDFIANDAFCSEQLNFHIVTGSNMSGKTTYLKQIAVLQVMVQRINQRPKSDRLYLAIMQCSEYLVTFLLD